MRSAKRTKKDILEIYEEYLNGSTTKEIDKKYNMSILRFFRKYNLETRKYGRFNYEFRSNSIELKYMFKSIENEQEAYIVGMFMADGYVGKQQLGLRLKKSDKDIVEKIKNYFSEDIKLQESGNSFSFVVSSEMACENAIKLGILENKSTKETFIPSMKEELIPHFIRGYFDGDGTIFICNDKKRNTKSLKSNICSANINILEEIQKKLSFNGIFSTINKENRIGKKYYMPHGGITISNQDMYRLYIRRKDDLKKFRDFIYKDSSLFLKRKKDIFYNNDTLLKKLK